MTINSRPHFNRRRIASALLAVSATVFLAYFALTWDLTEDRPAFRANTEDVVSSTLGAYYLPFRSHASPATLDERGLPLHWTGPINGFVHWTIEIQQYALEAHARHLRGGADDRDYRSQFLTAASWTLGQMDMAHGDFALWRERVPHFGHRIRPPWTSAMAQGQALSVLCRAYQLTNDEKYLRAAHLGFRAFEVPVALGGLRASVGENLLFFDEYPATPPTRVLNGYVFSLLGVWDFYRVTRNPRARDLFLEGVRTLNGIAWRYDMHGWSRYALYEGGGVLYTVDAPASMHYHRTHIELLRVLYSITAEPWLEALADRWEESIGSIPVRLYVWFNYRVLFRLQRVGAKLRLAWDVMREH